MKKNKEKLICAVVRDIGQFARELIRELPPEIQDVAWAAVGSDIAGAAINDSKKKWEVGNMIGAAVATMMNIHVHMEEQDDR